MAITSLTVNGSLLHNVRLTQTLKGQALCSSLAAAVFSSHSAVVVAFRGPSFQPKLLSEASSDFFLPASGVQPSSLYSVLSCGRSLRVLWIQVLSQL